MSVAPVPAIERQQEICSICRDEESREEFITLHDAHSHATSDTIPHRFHLRCIAEFFNRIGGVGGYYCPLC